MSNYTPGTLFRLCEANTSKHYTAVLLKDGTILEVKNPHTNSKTTYDSLDCWLAEYPGLELKIDASKSSGIVNEGNTNGFNYPMNTHMAFYFCQQLYVIINELAPQLLDSEELRLAYNNMVEVCYRHSDELYDWKGNYTGKNRYSFLNENNYAWREKWEGYPGYFYREFNYGQPYAIHQYTIEQYKEARKEILDAYKKIRNIINPIILPIVAKKCKILNTKKKISEIKALIRRRQKKIDLYKSNIENNNMELANLENELLRYEIASV